MAHYHYQGCTVLSVPLDKAAIQGFWQNNPTLTAAYYWVGDVLCYINCQGESQSFDMRAYIEQSLPEGLTDDEKINRIERKLTKTKALMNPTADDALAPQQKPTVIERIKKFIERRLTKAKPLTNPTAGDALTPQQIQTAIKRIKKFTDHDPFLFRIPIESVDEHAEPQCLIVNLRENKTGTRKHFDLYLDTQQEQTLLRHRANKALRNADSLVSLNQSKLAVSNKKSAKHQQHLQENKKKHQAELITLGQQRIFRQCVQLLHAPFNNLEALIKTPPKKNPLGAALVAVEKLKKDLSELINSTICGERSVLSKDAKQIFRSLLQVFNVEINKFIEQIKTFQREGISDKQLERLFAVQNRNAQSSLAQALYMGSVTENIDAIGQLELSLMQRLQAAFIGTTYEITNNRARQLAIKDHDVSLMAAAKKDTGLRAGVYGARHNNAREAIPETMLAQQHLIAFDSDKLKQRPKWLVMQEEPTLETARAEGADSIAYIQVGETLWYVNQARGECDAVPCENVDTLAEKLTKPSSSFGINVRQLKLESGDSLSQEHLDILFQHTGHSTVRKVPIDTLLDSSGDVEDLDDLLCLMTNRSYDDLDASKTEFSKTRPWPVIGRVPYPTFKTPLRAAEWVLRAPTLFPLELLFCVGRGVAGVVSMGVAATGAKETSVAIDSWASKAHVSCSKAIGYMGYQQLVNKTYERREKANDNNTDNHQEILEQVKQTPDNLFGAVCDQWLPGVENAAWIGGQVRGMGKALWNLPSQIVHLAFNNKFANAFKSQETLDKAVRHTVDDLKKDTEDATATLVLKWIKVVEDRRKLEQARAQNVDAEKVVGDLLLPRAEAVKPWHKAKTVSIFDFFDEVMVSGLTHALIWEMFQEAPAIAPLLFMMSSASMGLTMVGSAALPWLHTGPNAMGYALTGKHASEGVVSASVGNFAFFKIPAATSVLITKLYEGDTDFLKQLASRPEILLGFVLLVAGGYGFSCIPALPTHTHVGQGSVTVAHTTVVPATAVSMATTPLDAFINGLAVITTSLAEEALVCVEHGMPGPNSIELAFMALKSILFIEALLSGKNMPKKLKRDEKAIDDALRDIAGLKAGRAEAFDRFLKSQNINKSNAVRGLPQIKAFFTALEKNEAVMNKAHSADGVAVIGQVSTASSTNIRALSKESGPDERISPTSSRTSSLSGNDILSQPEEVNHKLMQTKKELNKLLTILRNHTSLGADAPKIDKPEVIWNRLHKLIEEYQNACRELGRHDLQKEIQMAETLRCMFLQHCYSGTVSGARPFSSAVGQVWRPIKWFATDSALERYRIAHSYRKDEHDILHLLSMGSEIGHATLEAVTYSAREVGFVPAAVVNGGSLKAADKAVTGIHLHGTNFELRSVPYIGWLLDYLPLPSFKWRREEMAEMSYQTDLHCDLAASLAVAQEALNEVEPDEVQCFAENITTKDEWASLVERERELHVCAAKRFAEEQAQKQNQLEGSRLTVANDTDNSANDTILTSQEILNKKPKLKLNLLERTWKSGAKFSTKLENGWSSKEKTTSQRQTEDVPQPRDSTYGRSTYGGSNVPLDPYTVSTAANLASLAPMPPSEGCCKAISCVGDISYAMVSGGGELLVNGAIGLIYLMGYALAMPFAIIGACS